MTRPSDKGTATRQRPSPEPVRTSDGRYLIVRGRLWRTSNPCLPPELREKLVRELMGARREVNAALRTHDRDRLARARKAVDVAKTSLGERGPLWWQDETSYHRYLVKNTPYKADFGPQILDLLRTRGPGKTICPSELLNGNDKQTSSLLDQVRFSAQVLASQGLIEFMQRGKVAVPGSTKGPIRLRLKTQL